MGISLQKIGMVTGQEEHLEDIRHDLSTTRWLSLFDCKTPYCFVSENDSEKQPAVSNNDHTRPLNITNNKIIKNMNRSEYYRLAF